MDQHSQHYVPLTFIKGEEAGRKDGREGGRGQEGVEEERERGEGGQEGGRKR